MQEALHAVLLGEALDLTVTEHRQPGEGGEQHAHAEVLVPVAELRDRSILVGIVHEVDEPLEHLRLELDAGASNLQLIEYARLVAQRERIPAATLDALKARGLLPKFDAGVDVFCLIEDEALRADSLKLITELRGAGKVVEYSFTPLKPDKQFKRAMELNAANTARLERTADGALQVKVKNLKTREERVVALAEAANSI